MPQDGQIGDRWLRGRHWKVPLPPFGESVDFRRRTKNKLDYHWERRVFLSLGLERCSVFGKRCSAVGVRFGRDNVLGFEQCSFLNVVRISNVFGLNGLGKHVRVALCSVLYGVLGKHVRVGPDPSGARVGPE